MKRNQWNLKEHAAWARSSKQGLNRYKGDYLFPHSEIWPSEIASFPDVANTILEGLEDNNRQQFITCCAAAWLLDPWRPGPVIDWINGLEPNVLINAGLELTLAEASDWKWKYTHVLTVKGYTGHLIRTLVGIGNKPVDIQFPSNQNIDNKTKESIRLAWKLAETGSTGAAFWPMLSFENNNGLIFGKSMGLPSYLAFKSFDSDQSIHSVIATGEINSNKAVLPVDGLCEKLEAAREAKFSIFIYPEPEQVCSLLTEKENIKPVAVQSLDEAELIWRSNTPQSSNSIAQIVRSQSPKEIISLLCKVPESISIYLENESRKISKSLQNDIIDVNTFQSLLEDIDNLMNAKQLQSKILPLIFEALNENQILNFEKKSLSLAFKICISQIHWLSYNGECEKIYKWKTIKDRIKKAAMKEIGLDVSELFDEHNLMMVTDHDSYIFDPRTPPSFQKKIMILEMFYDDNQLEHPGSPLKRLGQYYGTLIQNYAFCGPNYIKDVLYFCNKAYKAFGDSPEEIDEVMRIENYLIYAHLDAQNFQEAKTHLQNYLKPHYKNDIIDWNSVTDKFKHAATARFIAETGEDVCLYKNWIRHNWQKTDEHHPWQLWLYNSGRIFLKSEPDIAKECLNRSLKICKIFGGTTVKAMGLLSLAYLINLSHPSEHSKLATETDDIINSIKSSKLNQEHFSQVLNENNLIKCLETVRNNQQTLFPFTYR
ncbi:hypothetical protein [Desulfomicrobium baculatum]|uniref:Uncharacterized protein n=1 Tax=Desulfomicrobium baculatum (strain DSM 4028 / VKM B-1378 / X) TaxID=525897 RepID=C7LRV8_DESBD|nr:hypothetical protein [Desulfomicrobium baculatum]ACU89341.1 hypothetical protein Dbac_1238 [Desulfomicrobium baculatum DSM 4028]